jgi:hypothetical protein
MGRCNYPAFARCIPRSGGHWVVTAFAAGELVIVDKPPMITLQASERAAQDAKTVLSRKRRYSAIIPSSRPLRTLSPRTLINCVDAQFSATADRQF